MSIKNALKELLDNLDDVRSKHREIKDTSVREELRHILNGYFVYGNPDAEYPADKYCAMYTKKGDAAVHKAMVKFLTHPEIKAARLSMTPQERFEAFQDNEVQSASGHAYDFYFGWSPELPPEKK